MSRIHTSSNSLALVCLTMVCLVSAAALAFAGCSGKGSDSKDDKKPPAKKDNAPKTPKKDPLKKLGPSPFPELKVTVSGKPLPIHSAHAYWVGSEAVKLEFSTVPRGCHHNPRMRTVAPGERYFKIWLGKQLDTTGKASWAVVQSYFNGGTSKSAKDKVVTLTAVPKNIGKYIEGTLKLAQKGFPRRNRPAAPLTVNGKFKAVNCRVPKGGIHFVERTGDMMIDVAGVKTKVLGAKVKTVGDRTRVEISSDARSCRRSVGLARAVLKLSLKNGELKHTSLRGTWFATNMTSNALAKDAIAVKLGAPTDKGISLNLAGTFKLLGYPIKLSGTVNALNCSKKKPTKKPTK